MSESDDPYFAFEAVVESTLADTPDATQIEQLRRRLKDDPAALSAYLDQVRLHALLRWRHGQAVVLPPEASARPQVARQPWRATSVGRRWAVAAMLVAGTALAATLVSRPRRASGPATPAGVSFATVAEVRDVVWEAGQPPLAAGAPVPAGGVAIRSGSLRLRSDAGADVTLSGPARVRFVSALRLEALRGRVTARVGAEAHGFTIDAPRAQVVDLGTEFGVGVGEGGETDVVVFEGKVDLTPKSPSPAVPSTRPSPQRMVKGQGVRVTGEGTTRIVAVERRPGLAQWSVGGAGGPGAVIASVRDNRRDPAESKYYQIVPGGLAEDVPAYVDRCYEWNGASAAGMPAELRGADLVMTFNSDKVQPDLQLTVTLARPAVLYVFHEPRQGLVPEWLSRDFVDTGLTIGLDEGPPDMPQLMLGKGPGQSIDRVFHVWRREVREAGNVTLEENSPRSKSMYGIAAKALH